MISLRPRVVVVATAALALPLAGCETSSWTEKCSTQGDARSCDISVSGTKYHDMPLPFSGPLGGVADKFRLVSATKGAEAVFQGGGSDGDNRCRQGETITVGESAVTCTEVGDGSLRFTIRRG